MAKSYQILGSAIIYKNDNVEETREYYEPGFPIREAYMNEVTGIYSGFSHVVPTTGNELLKITGDRAEAVPPIDIINDSTISISDTTNNNASLAKHGFLPKLPGGTTMFLRADGTFATPAGGAASNSWDGVMSAAVGDGDPQDALQSMLGNPINPTPTNITITVARIAYFRLPANLIVNKIRFFGVGATTNVYRVAIYRASDRVRLTTELPFTTAAQAWGAAGSALNLTLTAGELYFIAVSVNAVGTTAGILALGATTGRIGVLPESWPGSLDINAGVIIPPFAYAQFAVTAGALPATAPTIALQAAWAGGMPSFFLDNSNA